MVLDLTARIFVSLAQSAMLMWTKGLDLHLLTLLDSAYLSGTAISHQAILSMIQPRVESTLVVVSGSFRTGRLLVLLLGCSLLLFLLLCLVMTMHWHLWWIDRWLLMPLYPRLFV